MKYLKKFEDVNSENIKTYIVWHGLYGYEILKFDRVTEKNTIWAYDYLRYEDGEFIDNESKNSSWINSTPQYILFTSDDLEECKQYILLQNTADKYNL